MRNLAAALGFEPRNNRVKVGCVKPLHHAATSGRITCCGLLRITLLPVILPVLQAQRLDKFLHLTSALKLLVTSQVEARPLQGSRVRGLAVNMADYHLSHEMVAGVAFCEETNASGHEEICRPSDLFTGSQYRMHGHNQGGFCYLVL